MAKEKRKCNNVSKVLDVDKKKDKYEKHKCKSSFLPIQSCHKKEKELEMCIWRHSSRVLL